MVKLRVFNDNGLEEFRSFLASCAAAFPAPQVPISLLDDPMCTSELPDDLEVDPERVFSNRLSAGEYLFSVLGQPEIDTQSTHLWSWLALLWFEQLCPLRGDGSRFGESYRYDYRLIYDPDYLVFHRHLLRMPYVIYRTYSTDPDKAILVLHNPITEPGDYNENLCSRQEWYTNPVVMETARMLYYDDKSKKPKVGGSSRDKLGDVHRLGDLLRQLEMTYDLYSITPQALLELLPPEFDKWKE